MWDSEQSLAAFLESDLRKTIPSAYELIEPPRIERFPIVDVLRAGGNQEAGKRGQTDGASGANEVSM